MWEFSYTKISKNNGILNGLFREDIPSIRFLHSNYHRDAEMPELNRLYIWCSAKQEEETVQM